MKNLIVQFFTGTSFGIPRSYFALATGLLAAEWALGRSKNPRLRSLAATAAAGTQRLLMVAKFGMIPFVGPLLVGLLGAVAGAPPAQPAPAPAPAPDPEKTNPGV